MSSTAQRWNERVPDEPAAVGTPGHAAERVAYYEELIRFESQILVEMREGALSLSAEASKEVEATNIDPLRGLIDELRRRRDSWAERRDSTVT